MLQKKLHLFSSTVFLLCLSAYLGIFSTVQSLTCVCTNATHYSPVCASNGRTYRNSKELYCYNVCNRWNLRIVANRSCSDTTATTSCTQCTYITGTRTVCGNDGLTYPSIQSLTCYKACRSATSLVALKTGACLTNCSCSGSATTLYAICGSDGNSYRNTEVLKCYNSCLVRTIKVTSTSSCKNEQL